MTSKAAIITSTITFLLQPSPNSIIMPPSHPILSWILTTSTDYAADGKLFLGQVLTDPYKPASALISGEPRTLPPFLKVEETERENPTLSSQNLLEHSAAVWLQTQGSVAGASAQGASIDSSKTSWKVKKIIGKLTTFKLAYVKESVLEEDDIKDHVKSRLNPFPPTLYIISGLRIFVGAKLVSNTVGSSTNLEGRASVDGTQLQIPARAGLGGKSTNAQTTEESFEKTSDFVFAYMCHEINYFVRTRISPFTGGQTASSDRVASGGEQEEPLELEVRDNCDPVKAAAFGAGEEADDVAHNAFGVGEVEVRYFLSC